MDSSERRAFQEAQHKEMSLLLLSSAGLSVRNCVFVCTRQCVSYTDTRNFNVNTIHSLSKLAFGLSPQVRSSVQRHFNCTVLFFLVISLTQGLLHFEIISFRGEFLFFLSIGISFF